MSSRNTFLTRLLPSRSEAAPRARGPSGTLTVAAAVFVLVAGIGTAASYLGARPEATSPAPSRAQDETLTRLKDYTNTITTKASAPAATTDKALPDVNTMIERLAARLEKAPEDAKGWRMLGWSYFNTGRYKEAASAYARAVALDPNSAELKDAFEEARAKASGTQAAAPALPLNAGADDKHGAGTAGPSPGPGPSADQVAAYQAMPENDRNAAIRAMVDGLASRLEAAPRDAEGWTRLMRSRVVLGEKDVAATAFRKALDIFKDDAAASGMITAAAAELGIKAE